MNILLNFHGIFLSQRGETTVFYRCVSYPGASSCSVEMTPLIKVKNFTAIISLIFFLQTSVFTPAYGSVTNVRVNSSMTTAQVLNLLLHKFRVSSSKTMEQLSAATTHTHSHGPFVSASVKVENKSEEFVLYMVHESGGESPLSSICLSHELRLIFLLLSLLTAALTERTRLRDDEYPLVARVLHGPCEKISKILITEADLGEEVTYDVSV